MTKPSKLIAAALLSLPAFGATFTSAATGNWNAGPTWGQAAGSTCHVNIPCGSDAGSAGDSVVLAAGFTVTIPLGFSASAGTSPTTDAGTAAISATANDTTAALIVNGSLTIMGPVRQNSATWTFGPGSSLLYDSQFCNDANHAGSPCASPTSVYYTWAIVNHASATAGKIAWNGTLGSPITVGNVVAANHFGGFGTTSGATHPNQGSMDCAYTTFTGVGNPAGVALLWHLSTTNLTWNHCTWDASSTLQIQATGTTSSANISIAALQVTRPASTSASNGSILLRSSATSITGTRTFQSSVIQGRINLGNTALGWTFRNIVLEPNTAGAQASIGTLFGPGWNFDTAVTAFDTDQILSYNQDWSAVDLGMAIAPGTHTNGIFFRTGYPGQNSTVPEVNFHPTNSPTTFGNITLDHAVLDVAISGGNAHGSSSDVLGVNGNPLSTAYFTVKNSVMPCGTTGYGPGSFINQYGGTPTNTKLRAENNAVCSTYDQTSGLACTTCITQGVGWEAITPPSGFVDYVRSNLFFHQDPSNTARLVLGSAVPTPTQTNAIAFAGYNAAYNSSVASMYVNNATGDMLAGSPVNDVYVTGRPPRFVDGTRHFLTFDSGYLGATVGSYSATQWSAGVTPSIGAVYWDQQSTIYGNAVMFWRATAACLSATGNRPITGTSTGSSAWTACWEPAVMQTLRAAVLAGTLYTDGAIGASGLSIIGLANAWIWSGYRSVEHTNTLCSGYNGATIGLPMCSQFKAVIAATGF